MLAELTVHNLVIVEKALLQPGEGLLVISGETGAGKSLLLDAIDIVSGARVRSGLVGRWGDSSSVTAVFQVDEMRAGRIAEVAQIPVTDGQVILRRRISESGRSQAWINDVPVAVTTLRAASDLLIDLHAQHEPIRLADPAVQLDLLDAFAGIQELARSYRAAHERSQALVRDLAALDGGGRESVKEADYLAFQLAAFEELSPKRGEFAQLERRQELLSSAGAWRDHAAHGAQVLTENDQAVATVLGKLHRRLESAPDVRLSAAAASLQQALEHVRDAAAHCSEAADAIESDPAELARVEERLDRWNDLLRKHGPDEDAAFAAWEDIAKRLADLSGLGERRQALFADHQRAAAERDNLGEKLAKTRAASFARLAEAVQAHLAELGMPKARIHLEDRSQPEPTVLGLRHQEVLVCTNPGQKPGSIRDVASGGEASRLMLAISAALAAVDNIPLMVFDEVDSGVGGRLGGVIGGKLAHLAVGRTVLAVTHTPQVAACGRRHYVVRKHQGDDVTVVRVSAVADAERETEIADMLGEGAAARAQAKELLGAVPAAPRPAARTKGGRT